MSNKKGFVLIETIITITVLAASLLYIYASFNNVLIKEKTRINYDDPAYIYRTYYLKEFFKNYELDYVLSLVNEDNPLVVIGCDYEGIFDENADAKIVCENLIQSLGVSKIAVGLNDLSYVKDCKNNNSNKCAYMNYFSAEEVTYFKSLGKIDKDQNNIMLFEYIESTDSSKSIRNYAWIKI